MRQLCHLLQPREFSQQALMGVKSLYEGERKCLLCPTAKRAHLKAGSWARTVARDSELAFHGQRIPK